MATTMRKAATALGGLLAAVLLALPVAAQDLDAATATKLDAALAGAHRDPANAARDTSRNPKQTLAFFGLRADMTVVEISPGGGWYSEVLAPVLAEQGRYIAAHNPINGSAGARRGLGNYLLKLAAHPDVYGKTEVVPFNLRGDPVLGLAPGSADMVLTFRNVHNWMGAELADNVFRAFFAALKPGGVLGVVEHRWPEDKPQDPKAGNGYVQESVVKRLAEEAGFRFVGASEVNANPKDTKDYPEGVWTLPPVLRLGDKDREKYVAIGESDRMTLKFVKPE